MKLKPDVMGPYVWTGPGPGRSVQVGQAEG
jgi:hypothetical protein